LVAPHASANERHFTYTYESAVLSPGKLELEPWTTFRVGRENFYTRFDQRLEFEAGVVDGLQTALYWNMTAVAEDVTSTDPALPPTETRVQSFSFTGISSEWKYQLSDPVADPLGFALYFEGTAGLVEAELEAKLIFDKRVGDLLLAANVVGEHEWVFEVPGETEREVKLELDLAGGLFLSQSFLLGLEVRNQTVWASEEGFEGSAFFAGPVVAYAQDTWWTGLTILPQIAAIKPEEEAPLPPGEEESALDLEHHERLEVRLLLGFQLR